MCWFGASNRPLTLLVVLVGDHPDADNVEHMKAVWTLCQSLWGDIPDNYRVREGTPAYQASGDYEREQIRKRLLSEWLADVSGHRVERECKMHKFNKVYFDTLNLRQNKTLI